MIIDAYTFDLQRMLFGDLSWGLLFEIGLRIVILYFYNLLMLRIVGNRGVAVFSGFEVTLVIVLGSAVGNPLFFVEIPVIHAMFVITLITLLQLGMIAITSRSSRMEDLIEGVTHRIVVDGMFDREGMRIGKISREEVAIKLRVAGARQLGEVQGAYLESTGEVSVFRYEPGHARPGIYLAPPWDVQPPMLLLLGTAAPAADRYACHYCGQVTPFALGERLGDCSRCGKNEKWLTATAPD